MLPRLAAVIAGLIELQPHVRTPLSQVVGTVLPASWSPMLGGTGELKPAAALSLWAARGSSAILRRIRRSPTPALTGPLTAISALREEKTA